MTVTGYIVVVKDEPLPGVPSFRAYGPSDTTDWKEPPVAHEVAASLRARGIWAEAMPLRDLSEIMLETH